MYNPNTNRRGSIRLKGYDYSQCGAYFITICTQNKECLFGKIVDGEMALNDAGTLVQSEWVRTAELRKNVKLDVYIVMPNHFHGILFIVDKHCCRGVLQYAPTGNTPQRKYIHTNEFRSPSQTIGSIVRGFKSAATKQINEMRNITGLPVWQRNYYDHIIRNEMELNRIREYIINNPLRWHLDRDNPKGTPDENEKKFWTNFS